MSTSKPPYDPNKIPDSAPQALKENKNYQYFMSHQKEWIEKGYKQRPVYVSNEEAHIWLPDFTPEQQHEFMLNAKKTGEDDKTTFKGLIGFPLGPRHRSHR